MLQSHDQPRKKKKQGRSVGEKRREGGGGVSNIWGLHKTVEELATFCQLCLIIAALSSIQFIYYTMSPKLASFCFDRKGLDIPSDSWNWSADLWKMIEFISFHLVLKLSLSKQPLQKIFTMNDLYIIKIQYISFILYCS